MTLAFHMTADQALQFFELAHEFNLTTEDERIGLLRELIAAGWDITVFQTNRTPEQVAKDYSKHGDVLYVKLEETDETDTETQNFN